MTQYVLWIRTIVYGIILIKKKRKFKNPKTNSNAQTSNILIFKTLTSLHFLCEYIIVCFLMSARNWKINS